MQIGVRCFPLTRSLYHNLSNAYTYIVYVYTNIYMPFKLHEKIQNNPPILPPGLHPWGKFELRHDLQKWYKSQHFGFS